LQLVTDSGAILLGRNFEIDGYAKRPFRGVTHFHSDHIVDIGKSVRDGLFVIGTEITLEALEILGERIPKSKKLHLDYGVEIELLGERVRLRKADHIIGSTQFEIRSDDVSYAYTGDFKNPGKSTEILNPDVLVIDATYGSPSMRRYFRSEIELLLADYVRDKLIQEPVAIYAYHGKIQEVMLVLRKHGIDAPFIADGKVWEITKLAQSKGYDFGTVLSPRTKEGREVIRDNWYVVFKHYHEFKRRDGKYYHFALSGWQLKEPFREIDPKSMVVGYSSHADFEETLYYIDNSTTDHIVIDGYRSSYAVSLAAYIKKNSPNKKVYVSPKPMKDMIRSTEVDD
jgi:Predicted exonuclease of the beta-lactamase fold involved in RNA processing